MLFLGCLFVISCASTNKVNCKKQPFEELDSLQKAQKILNYSMKFPENWQKSKFSGGDWYFIKGEFIDSLGYYDRLANVYVSSEKVKSNCKDKYSIDDYLKLFLERKKRWSYKDFKYSLVKTTHKKYGEMYILKFKEIFPHVTYESGVFLIFYNRIGYTIQYKNDEKKFKKYIQDIEKMIESFTIKE